MATSKIMLAMSLVSAATAHMFIQSPAPIQGSAPKDPLDHSGSNFPCHGISLPSSGGQEMKAGSQQLLAFDLGHGANTAVHGGGSCQISVTYETDAAKQKDPKNWKVIYSIEGGCPTDAAGNLAFSQKCTSGDEPECVNQFPFTIPQGVKDGHAIMAWTWFNNVGNREMYMNCMNVNFSGGDGSEVDSMPAMFVANLASIDKCPTTESVNVKFPQAGKYQTTKTQGNPYPLAVPTGDGCSVASDASNPLPPTPSATITQPESSLTNVSSATVTPIPQASSVASFVTSTSTNNARLTTAAPRPSTGRPFAWPPQATKAAGACRGGQVSCPRPGQIVCIDSNHFGLCDIDHCAVSQSVAAGTLCEDDRIVASNEKRGYNLKKILMKHKKAFLEGNWGAPWPNAVDWII